MHFAWLLEELYLSKEYKYFLDQLLKKDAIEIF